MDEKKSKVEPDAASSSGTTAAAASAAPRRLRNRANRSGEPSAKPVRVATPSSKFDGTCDGLRGRGLVFDSADTRADRFMQMKREIIDYIGKE
mmetsp:Transcript_29273/g.86680  ORF Transcript_29273/g.86680 Transcript_29273/m.86680 type:complete len:93 (+) Transcript_29273:120-398(+)